MKIFYCFTLLLYLFSCTNSSNQKNEKVSEHAEKIKLTPSDIIEIPIGFDVKYNALVEAISIQGDSYIACLNKKSNTYIIYDYKSKKKVKEIKFDTEGPNGVGTLEGVKIITWDSIYVLQGYTPRLYLADSAAIVKKMFDLAKTENGNSVAWMNASPRIASIDTANGQLYLYKIPDFMATDIQYFEDTMQLIFNPKNNRLLNKTGNFPDMYKRGVFYGDFAMFGNRIVNKAGQTVFSFSIDHRLFVYNDTALIQSYSIKSSHVPDNPIPPKADLFNGTFDEKNAYAMQLNVYQYLRYSVYHDLIFRVVAHSEELYDSVGNQQKFWNKPFSVQIINNKFELVEEIEFPKNTYSFDNLIAVPEGLLISLNNDSNPDLKENSFRFQLFKIEVEQ